jgi:hypothetical protein
VAPTSDDEPKAKGKVKFDLPDAEERKLDDINKDTNLEMKQKRAKTLLEVLTAP